MLYCVFLNRILIHNEAICLGSQKSRFFWDKDLGLGHLFGRWSQEECGNGESESRKANQQCAGAFLSGSIVRSCYLILSNCVTMIPASPWRAGRLLHLSLTPVLQWGRLASGSMNPPPTFWVIPESHQVMSSGDRESHYTEQMRGGCLRWELAADSDGSLG